MRHVALITSYSVLTDCFAALLVPLRRLVVAFVVVAVAVVVVFVLCRVRRGRGRVYGCRGRGCGVCRCLLGNLLWRVQS